MESNFKTVFIGWVTAILSIIAWAFVFESTEQLSYRTMIVTITISLVILAIWESIQYDGDDTGPIATMFNYFTKANEDKIKSTQKSFKLWKPITALIFMLMVLVAWNLGGKMSKTYNTSKLYQNKLSQIEKLRIGYYDKMWNTYLQTKGIADVNKDVFIEVTKIIMESRKDGMNIAWKWVHENQNIPYEEFTKFYSSLTNFIVEQREGYFQLENQCMGIVNANNTLLDTFPNNVYNVLLKCPKLTFEYGFTSERTNETFKSKIESIK